MGGGGSAPQYVTQTASQPDPTQTANAQATYNIQSAQAQNQLNNVNQVTPYGNVTYTQTGGAYVGGKPAVAAKPATGGYWNGYSWVPTGGSPGQDATQGNYVPQYTATTTLNPAVQALVNQGLYNSAGVGNLESNLIGQISGAKYPTYSNPNYYNNPNKLDLSWGNIAKNIYGLERNTLDPYWKQQQDVTNQQLADQGLTPGSQGWGYQQTQLNKNKADAYTNAMLGAQQTAANDLTGEYNAANNKYNTAYNAHNDQYNTAYNAGVNQYNNQYNTLNALRSGQQINQPGVGQTATTSQATVGQSPYAQTANQNYQTASNYNAQIAGLQNSQYQQQQSQQENLLGGLFGLGSKLIGIASDRRDKTDIKRLGKDEDSGLPMYAYRYKGDPKSYPKVVGPMAQDVEKQYPGSTSEIEGHKFIPFGLGAPTIREDGHLVQDITMGDKV